MISPIYGILKSLTHRTQTRMTVTRVGGGVGVRKILVKDDQFPIIRQISSGDLKYSLVSIVNNTVTYLKFSRRINIKCSYHKEK